MKTVDEIVDFMWDLLNAKDLEESDLISIKEVITEYEHSNIGSYSCKCPENCFLDSSEYSNSVCPNCVEENVDEYRENLIEKSKSSTGVPQCPYPSICSMGAGDKFCPECGKKDT